MAQKKQILQIYGKMSVYTNRKQGVIALKWTGFPRLLFYLDTSKW